jgi:tetratricopeptide (TPR) repeat protein
MSRMNSTAFLRARASAALLAALLAAGAAAPSALGAQHHDHAAGHGALGTVNFQVSCAQPVRADFDRALALLHHMMYTEARAAFQQIAERDPRCAMAHWGLAMTRFQPLWSRPAQEEVQRGWESLERARRLGPATPRERALVAGTAGFLANPQADEWFTRLQRWAAAMRDAHRAHPDDADIAAFYALSEIAAGQTASGNERLEYNARAADLLLRVHERIPEHPGALHYTIHANDVSGRAGESLELVHSYDQVAPSVPHALHMPTHIFVRLGKWDDVIEWNRKSADAALNFPAGDRTSMHHIHALDYLLYAHLQRGEDEKARAVLQEMRQVERYDEQFASAFHLAVMPARLALERRAWDEAAAITPRQPAYVNWDRFQWPEAMSWFTRGLGALLDGNTAVAIESEARMRTLRDGAREAGAQDHATYIEVDRLILAGGIAFAEGRPDSAVALMQAATEKERSIQKHPVSPGALLPAYEAKGELLMMMGQPKEALAAFEASLEEWPLRYNSLLGAARSARAAGDESAAQRYYSQLVEVAGENATRASLNEAKAFLTARR